jgi:hypothetical protein
MAKMRATTLTPAPVGNEPATFSLGPPVQPTCDPIELLPAGAADKLRALRQRSADAHAVVPNFETISEANTARLEAAARLKRLVDHPSDDGFNLPPTDQRVVEQQRRLDKN